MNLGEFHSLVSTSLKRGNALDEFIPAQTKLAVQWLERNYAMKYMEKFRLLQVEINDRIITMPENVMIRSVKFIRLVQEDGYYNYLKKVEPSDILSLRGSAYTARGGDLTPRGYFIIGLGTLVLDAIPAAAWNGEAIFHEYTDWPTQTTATHPLLRMASDVLLAQTQIFMAINITKDVRLMPAYKEARDEGVNTLTRAEDDNNFGGESVAMAYTPSGS